MSDWINDMNKTLEKMHKFDNGFASVLYGQISRAVKVFEGQLDNEHEVGVRLVNFGQAIQFHVTEISYEDPSLIAFNGFLDDGSPVKLIQHTSQISFLLIKMKRLKPEEPKKPIGFHS